MSPSKPRPPHKACTREGPAIGQGINTPRAVVSPSRWGRARSPSSHWGVIGRIGAALGGQRPTLHPLQSSCPVLSSAVESSRVQSVSPPPSQSRLIQPVSPRRRLRPRTDCGAWAAGEAPSLLAGGESHRSHRATPARHWETRRRPNVRGPALLRCGAPEEGSVG